jgi:mono/diheme cytochrome c family protein
MRMTKEGLRKGALLAFLLAALLTLAACGATPAPTAAPTVAQPTGAPTQAPTAAQPTNPPQVMVPFPPGRPSAVQGQAIFEANCATCHGAAGDGSGLPGAANFTDVAFVRSKTPAEFYTAIHDGVAGSAMPAWGDKLSEMEIWDVLYYERSFATSADQIAEGQTLFAQSCTACHGAAGDGSGLSGAANFTDQAFVSAKTPQEFFTSITNGVAGSAMPPWGATFTEDQVWALVNYVWTFAYEYPQAQQAPTPEPTAAAPGEPSPSPVAAAPTDTPQPAATPTAPRPWVTSAPAWPAPASSSTRCCSGCGPAKRPCPLSPSSKSVTRNCATSTPGSNRWRRPRPRPSRPRRQRPTLRRPSPSRPCHPRAT